MTRKSCQREAKKIVPEEKDEKRLQKGDKAKGHQGNSDERLTPKVGKKGKGATNSDRKRNILRETQRKQRKTRKLKSEKKFADQNRMS